MRKKPQKSCFCVPMDSARFTRGAVPSESKAPINCNSPLVNSRAQANTRPMTLTDRIDAKRDDLIALTQALIRIPTLNPPGMHYHDVCVMLDKRLKSHGFETELIRARGTPGDSDTYPRWNLVARRAGTQPGECVHFNSHHDVVEVGHGWTRDPFGAAVEGDKIYGRGACDMKGDWRLRSSRPKPLSKSTRNIMAR